MAGITQAQAESKLAEWLAADTAVATKQSYTINGRTLTLADVKEIRENIDYWNEKVIKLSDTTRTGPVVRGVTVV